MSSRAEDTLPLNLEQYFGRLTLQPIIHGRVAPPMPPPKHRSTLTPLTVSPAGYRKLREMHRFDLSTKTINCGSKYIHFVAFLTSYIRFLQAWNCRGRVISQSPSPLNTRQQLSTRPWIQSLYHQQHNKSGKPTVSFFVSHEGSARFSGWKHPRLVVSNCLPASHWWRGNSTPRSHPSLSSRSFYIQTVLSQTRYLSCLPLGVRSSRLCWFQFHWTSMSYACCLSRSVICDSFHHVQFDDTVSTDWESRTWVNADKMWAHVWPFASFFSAPRWWTSIAIWYMLRFPVLLVRRDILWTMGIWPVFQAWGPNAIRLIEVNTLFIDYTNAWVTPTLHFDNKPLSIIEMLAFWIHTSFDKQNTFTLPNVRFMVNHNSYPNVFADLQRA